MKKMKRALSLLLAVVMVLGLAPITVGAADNWYDAYRDFVLNERYLSFDGPRAQGADDPYTPDFDIGMHENISHYLYDLDRDGVPELLISNGGMSTSAIAVEIFRFTDQGIVYLGYKGGFCIGYDESGTYPGLFYSWGNPSTEVWSYLTVAEGELSVTYIAESNGDWDNIQLIPQTSDQALYAAYEDIYLDETGSREIFEYSLADIRSMGWDTFVASYGYEKSAPAQDTPSTPEQSGFSDVKESAWYAGDVADIQKYGLINGHPDGTFRPQEKLTLAQAITLAARTHAQLNGKSDIKNGSPWYQPYVDYAAANGLCSAGEFGMDYNGKCSRLTMAVLFQRAFPIDTEQEKNTVTSLPDVKDEGYGSSVFYLYRQGVLTGNDEFGTFKPDKSVSRAEASAILNRVMDAEKRKSFTLEAGEKPASQPTQEGRTLASYTGMTAGEISDLFGTPFRYWHLPTTPGVFMTPQDETLPFEFSFHYLGDEEMTDLFQVVDWHEVDLPADWRPDPDRMVDGVIYTTAYGDITVVDELTACMTRGDLEKLGLPYTWFDNGFGLRLDHVGAGDFSVRYIWQDNQDPYTEIPSYVELSASGYFPFIH